MQYYIRYKKGFFWKKLRVIGHVINFQHNRIEFEFPDRTFISLNGLDKIDFELGPDFFEMKKQQMENESGQGIPVRGVK